MTLLDNQIARPPLVGWVPVLYQMIDTGDLSRMHASAAAVYLAIKRHANIHTGISEASNTRIMRETGLSKPTFGKARDSLIEHGYISRCGASYPTRYIIHEKIQYLSADNTPVAFSTFPYIPALLHKLLDALRAQPLTEELIGTTIKIGAINIQINLAAGSVVDDGEEP